MKIRPMRTEDLDEVLSNEFTGYNFPWTRGIFADCLKVGHQCWVIERDSELIGHAVVTVGSGESHLLNVCVRGSEQGAGIGRKLTMYAIEQAHAAGADALFLEVRPSNHVALKLYDSIGFTEVGVRKDYYPALLGHEDAQVLVLDLESFFRNQAD